MTAFKRPCHENLVRIQLIIHKILCRQESVMPRQMPTLMPTQMVTMTPTVSTKQEAHLSDIATADMQMLCNIFQILSAAREVSSCQQETVHGFCRPGKGV